MHIQTKAQRRWNHSILFPFTQIRKTQGMKKRNNQDIIKQFKPSQKIHTHSITYTHIDRQNNKTTC